MAEASFEALRKVQLHEKNYPSLAPLEQDFFEKYRVLLLQQRERLRADFSLEAASLLEGIQRLLNEVMRMREQKIFLKALRDFHAGTVSGDGLAAEERETYSALVKMLSEYGQKLLGDAGASKPAAKPDAVVVRILADLPAFVGASGQLGPFAAGNRASLAREDARLLVEQGVAQEV